MLGAKRYKLKYVAESKAVELRENGYPCAYIVQVYDNTVSTKRKIRYIVVAQAFVDSIKYVMDSEIIGEA